MLESTDQGDKGLISETNRAPPPGWTNGEPLPDFNDGTNRVALQFKSVSDVENLIDSLYQVIKDMRNIKDETAIKKIKTWATTEELKEDERYWEARACTKARVRSLLGL